MKAPNPAGDGQPLRPAGADELARKLAQHLRDSRSEIVGRWLERISARVSIAPGKIFPSEELLNHVPVLLEGLADYLDHPEAELHGDATVLAKSMELGALRHEQGFNAYEILKEHEILGRIIDNSLSEFVVRENIASSPPAVIYCWRRVAEALESIRQAAATHFLRLWTERVNEREERLRRFNRMVSHELKNRVGAIRGAVSLLEEPWLDATGRERFQHMIRENVTGLERVLDNLIALSRLEEDARQQRNVLLPEAAAEVVRQLRTAADYRGVEVQIDPGLPNVEVDAAAVELCLTNYVSNAIKYSDPGKRERLVEIAGELRYGPDPEREARLIIRVRDNGIGVPQAARPHLFERFFRVQGEETEVEGTGLGLSIVRETVESLGGQTWAEFPDDGGTIFTFSLPSRRTEDAASAGTRRQPG